VIRRPARCAINECGRTGLVSAAPYAPVHRTARPGGPRAGLTSGALTDTCARLRPITDLADPVQATKAALRRLTRRHQQLCAEIRELDAELAPLVTAAAPRLLALPGVGVEVAGQLLVTAGDNRDRLGSEAAFAHLCGVAPIPASSGRTDRHRLNRGGDRAANNALHTIALSRLRWDARTRTYMARRRQQGLTSQKRCAA
jgi:transposase